MEISKSFVVNVPPAAAWDFLTEPARVVRCLPGAALGEQVDEQTYGGTIGIKVGPVQASYRGTLKFERLDREAWTAELSASGQETRGRGGARMKMTSRLVERAPGETEVHVTSDVQVMGVLAQFGRGMIQDVSDQLFQKFVDCARAELESAPAPAEAAEPTAPASTPTPAPAPAPEPEPALAAASAGGVPPEPAVVAASAPAAASAAVPIDVVSLGTAALGRAAGRALRRPATWAVAVLVLLVLFWLFSR